MSCVADGYQPQNLYEILTQGVPEAIQEIQDKFHSLQFYQEKFPFGLREAVDVMRELYFSLRNYIMHTEQDSVWVDVGD